MEWVLERVSVSAKGWEKVMEMAMVGRTVSTVKVTELLASAPSLLVLPAESENLEEATEITPLVVLLVVGVKVAV